MTIMNSHTPASSALKVLATLLTAVAAMGTVTDASAHGNRCKSLDGDFTSIAVAPPTCTSPVGICTIGTLVGDLPSSYYFVMDSLDWAGDPANPTKFVYTGHSKITDTHGNLIFGSDTGVMYINPDPTIANPFVTTVHIVGGTKKYTHATGQIVATGNLTFATGYAEGTYASSICKGAEHDDDDDDGDDDHHGHCH